MVDPKALAVYPVHTWAWVLEACGQPSDKEGAGGPENRLWGHRGEMRAGPATCTMCESWEHQTPPKAGEIHRHRMRTNVLKPILKQQHQAFHVLVCVTFSGYFCTVFISSRVLIVTFWQLSWLYSLCCTQSKWQSTPVLLPGKSHGHRSLVGYSPWGRKESDTTEQRQNHPK